MCVGHPLSPDVGSNPVDNHLASNEDVWPLLLMRMWFGHFLPCLINSMAFTHCHKLWRDKSHDGLQRPSEC